MCYWSLAPSFSSPFFITCPPFSTTAFVNIVCATGRLPTLFPLTYFFTPGHLFLHFHHRWTLPTHFSLPRRICHIFSRASVPPFTLLQGPFTFNPLLALLQHFLRRWRLVGHFCTQATGAQLLCFPKRQKQMVIEKAV